MELATPRASIATRENPKASQTRNTVPNMVATMLLFSPSIFLACRPQYSMFAYQVDARSLLPLTKASKTNYQRSSAVYYIECGALFVVRHSLSDVIVTSCMTRGVGIKCESNYLFVSHLVNGLLEVLPSPLLSHGTVVFHHLPSICQLLLGRLHVNTPGIQTSGGVAADRGKRSFRNRRYFIELHPIKLHPRQRVALTFLSYDWSSDILDNIIDNNSNI
jgi:hypothetical protein